ncbi:MULTISPECIES: hypothetical protein [Ramlibacter]|uniref:Uncharacterized protein n=1 Tax=Ramlibacter aquaticus TaxID=2780094 RepID=A0ABR9SLV3_9BURK|nr:MULTISPECIES: hypothetical protein [Ramlibacter]MBE7942737.1 hypothetical protein [Ramlibacter aquaticus]
MKTLYGDYEIETDRHGSYTIRVEGRLVRRLTALTAYPGRPRFGNRKLEVEALEDAKRYLDALSRRTG